MTGFKLEIEEIRALIQGKFQARPCLNCGGKGWVWCDGTLGIEVQNPDPSRDATDYYTEVCYECNGLGCNIIFTE